MDVLRGRPGPVAAEESPPADRAAAGISPPLPADDELRDIKRSERTMILARWVAAPWTFLQVTAYSTMPYPSGVETLALLLASALAVGNGVIWWLNRRTTTVAGARRLAIGSLAFDVCVASAFVWLYAFDQLSALWAVLFILPLEGALRFQLAGALGSWAAVTALYAGREVWGSGRYGYRFQWDSVSFRMGIAFLIAMVAGLMARNLVRERRNVAEALAELRRVDRMRSALVSMLAHDVRTPLTVIRSGIRTLLGGRGAVDPSVTRDLLQATDRQARRLESLATQLLELARMEQGELELRLREIPVRGAVERALSYVDDQGRIEVRIPEGLAVRADPERLEQVVVNLAENALRHGEPPFVVEGGERDGRVVLSFVDHGSGVKAEAGARLFEPFATGVRPTSVGLGLATARVLVEAHGGEISYVPNQPRGSRFVVELPRSPQAA